MNLKDLATKLKNYQPNQLDYSLIHQVKEARENDVPTNLPFGEKQVGRPLLKLAQALRKQANEEQNNLIKKAHNFIDATKGLSILRSSLNE